MLTCFHSSGSRSLSSNGAQDADDHEQGPQGPGAVEAGEDGPRYQAEAAEERRPHAGDGVGGRRTLDRLLDELEALGHQPRRLGERVGELGQRAQALLRQPQAAEALEQDAVDVLARELGHVEVAEQHVPDRLEGHQRLDHEHHLHREVHAVARRLAHRLQDQPPERVLVEARPVRPAPADVLDVAAEAGRIGAGAGLGDRGQRAGGALGVAHDEAEVVVEEAALEVAVEPPDHAQVDEGALRPRQHQEVARVEVGVEEAVAVEHADDRFGAELDQAPPVLLAQLAGARLGGLDPVDVFLHQQARARELAVDAGENDALHVAEAGGEGLGVVGLAREVDLAQRVLAELADHPPRLVAAEEELQEDSQETQQRRVAPQGGADARLDDLEDHLLAVQGGGEVDLADRGGAERGRADVGEDLDDRTAEVASHQLEEALVGHGGQAVEEVLELVGDRPRQQVLAHAEDLAELDVGRPQHLQAPPELDREGLAPQLAVDAQAQRRRDEAQQQDPEPPPLPPRQRAQPGRQAAEGQGGEMALGRQEAAQQAVAAGVDELAVDRLVAGLRRIGDPGESGGGRLVHGRRWPWGEDRRISL
jgi:hypothetical protein